MADYKPRIPYRQRITEYCERHGIVIPSNFDAPKSSEKYVLVDLSAEPHTLVPRSSYLPADVIRYLTNPQNAGRQFRILDFKRCCELSYSGGNKLVRGAVFEGMCRDEIVRGAL